MARKTKREFYNRVVNSMRDGIKEVEKEQERLAEIISRRQRQVDSGMFDSSYVQTEIQPEIRRLKKESEELEEKLTARICGMCDEYITELESDDNLKPNELTSDIQLLQAGIELNEKDITAMLKRNADNRTMSQIIMRFATEHNIDTGMIYEGNQPVIEVVEALAGTVPTVIKWHDRPDVFEKLLGEGSELATVFGDDE